MIYRPNAITDRPYANPDFMRLEAGEAKPCLSPTKEGEFGFAPPKTEIKSQDLHKALIFWFFFIKKKEQDVRLSVTFRKTREAPSAERPQYHKQLKTNFLLITYHS